MPEYSAIIGGGSRFLPASANYHYVEIPFNAGQIPDSVILQVQSSAGNNTLVCFVGSDLKIDEIHFKSQPLNTGIFNYENDRAVSIFPNPAHGRFEIRGLEKCVQGLEIFNGTGEKVYKISNLKQQTSIEIDLSNFPKGIYIVKLYDGKGNHTEKVMIR